MATGRASKNAKRLQDMHDYLHKKVEDIEKERSGDRTYNHKAHLVKLKKEKLAVKDQIRKNET
jgi:uncharacterized protein YdcH (DUF465 family)|tara:strand:- start:1647 stop:1835 length:189 start_codon:yes stop_codon:yes gene_type:complete